MGRSRELLRKEPSQARAKKTFDHIIATSCLLLDEVGWDGFNTNLVAQRAGVSPQTLYRYFPDKMSIMATIADRLIAKWNLWFDAYDAAAPPDMSPGAFWVGGARNYLEKLRREPGGVAMRRAMKSSPVLREMDLDDTKQIAARMARIGGRRGHCRPGQEIEPIFLMLLESVLALSDLSFECEEAVAARVLEEGFEMHRAHLDRVLAPGFDA